MNRTLYTLLFYFAIPLVFFRLLWRSRKAPDYRRRWGERLGFYGVSSVGKQSRSIIFHAVSVGEVHAAVPLIKLVQAEFPQWQIVLTTSTPTGSARVKAIFAESLRHVYLPYDLPGALNRFLDFANADLLVIMETELWPNLIHCCGQRGVKVILANARLSLKSFNNYQKHPAMTLSMLQGLSCVAAQATADGEHFIDLGLPASKVKVTGNVKFDIDLDNEQSELAKAFKANLESRPVLVAGSTREGEEEKVLSAFQAILQVRPDALLVLVPRHPERFELVFDLAKNQGLAVVKRSEQRSLTMQDQVLLGNSMGEMQFYYGLADLAFVGGSLVDTGCQNIIEPAALGVPVITGPSLFNFRAVSQSLIEAGVMRVVQNSSALAEAVLDLLADSAKMKAMSLNAEKAIKANQGATDSLMALIREEVTLIQATHSK